MLRCSVAILCLMCISAAAHDMWLVSGISGAENKVCARIGETFPGTVNAPTADRVTLFRFQGPGSPARLEGTFADKQFCAPLPSPDGVAEMVVHPRLNQLDAKRFGDFVRMEGLGNVVKQPGTDAVKYLYSRYSKAVVGKPARELLTRPLQHVLEIIPQADPSSLKAGEGFPVLVLFRGRPLADAQVAAIHEGASGEAGSFPVMTRTDARGMAVLKLSRSGLWYARLIYTIPADDPEFQFHHFFSTLTFHAGEGAASQ